MVKFFAALVSFASLSAIAGEAVDYRSERLALAATAGYNAYTLTVANYGLLDKHFRLANDPKATNLEVNEPLRQLLDIYPLGIQVNYAVADFLDHLLKSSKPSVLNDELRQVAAERRSKADAILKSILSSGDGRSTDTAFQVINTVEEYDVIRHLGLDPLRQVVLTHAGKTYDVITSRDKDGSQHELYFDVSLFYDESKRTDSFRGTPLPGASQFSR